MMKLKRILSFIILGMVAAWFTKERITYLVLGGKNFSSRSTILQVLFYSLYSLVIAGLIYLLFKLFREIILPKLNSLNERGFFIRIRQLPGKFVFLPVIFAAVLWGFVLWCVPNGFDITDNGYYLMNSYRFDDVAYEIRLFGIFTRLIFLAAGGSVAIMRVLGALLLLGLSLACGFFASKVTGMKGLQQKIFFLITPAIPAAMYYYDWLSTPSYNWLALISGLCLIIGLLLYLSKSPNSDFISGIILSGSCFIAFFAKPTTAVLFFALSVFVVLVERKKQKNILSTILGGAVGLIGGVIFIYLNGQTIPGIVEKITRGNYAISLFAHSFFSIFEPLFVYIQALSIDLYVYWLVILSIFIYVLVFIDVTRQTKNRIFGFLWLIFLLLSGLYFDAGTWAGFSFVLTLLLVALTMYLSKPDSTTQPDNPGTHLLRSLYVLSIALAIAFGTINNYYYYFAHIFCIFILAELFLIEALPPPIKNIVQQGFVLILLIIVPYNMFFVPIQKSTVIAYRQDINTWDMHTSTAIRLGKEKITVSPEYADAFSELQNSAVSNGFTEGTPVIDLSGMAPGIIYVLDGRSPVYPWLAGGYANSTQFARNILGEWKNDDIQQAWILTSKIFTSLPDSLLTEKGLDFPGGYQQVTAITIPIATYDDYPTFILWKPVQSNK